MKSEKINLKQDFRLDSETNICDAWLMKYLSKTSEDEDALSTEIPKFKIFFSCKPQRQSKNWHYFS